MSLRWQMSNEQSPAWVNLSPVMRETMIFGLVIADMGEIKDEAAAEKFWTRLRMAELAQGDSFVHQTPAGDGPMIQRWITLADCRAAIGLGANVRTTTDAQYNRKVAGILRDTAVAELRRAKDAK